MDHKVTHEAAGISSYGKARLIQQRHSIRTFFDLEKPIPKGDLESILEAARWMPTNRLQAFTG
ncbi:MAG: nitroreductase family protein [Candidatus Xenobiia bacterium LiM19]